MSDLKTKSTSDRRDVTRLRQLRALMSAVESAVAEGRPADVFVTAEFRRHREWGSRDRRLLSRLVFSALRWRGWLGRYTENGDRVLIGAHGLEATEHHPLADRLAAGLGLDPATLPPVGDAGLEEKAAALSSLIGGAAPDVRDLVPAWFPELLATPPEADPAQHLRRCIESFQQRPPLWLRAVRMDGAELRDRLVRAGHVAETGRPERAVRLVGEHPHLATLDREIGPCYEVQDLASICVGHSCGAVSGERWWDVCGGAGGKALHLAESGAQVWVSDLRERTLAEAERRARRIGGLQLRFVAHDGTRPLPDASRFDGVLVDAPCSGVGTWSRRPDARWQCSPQAIADRAALQRRLLDNAAAHVRPGGRLVYAVCTLTRAETLDVVAAFGTAHPEFAPDPAVHPIEGGAPAGPLWVWPWQGPGGGMFIARWRNRAGG